MRILVVDDQSRMAELIRRGLTEEGHMVDVAGTGADGIWRATEIEYDAIVLDVALPDIDGYAVCGTLRRRQRWAPIVMVTARDAVASRIRGLDIGADDYLTKPFAFGELLARLRAVARRPPRPRPVTLAVGDLHLDPATRAVERGGVRIDLTAKEFALLEYLMRHAGAVLNRGQILEHVWDYAYDGDSNVVDVYVRYLRQKIDRPFDRHTLRTVRGVGYGLSADDPA